jgi:pyruvate,orthophosphate dikinase
MVSTFDADGNVPDGDAVGLLGVKGASLAAMTRLGLPVPPGFTILTPVSTAYLAAGNTLPPELCGSITEGLAQLERRTGRRFGSAGDPLILSVRASARVAMPGALQTILNLGLNEATVEALAVATGDRRFALDCYRRFIQIHSAAVLGLDGDAFEDLLQDAKDSRGLAHETDFSAEDWEEVIAAFKDLVEAELGEPFPQDPMVQLLGAIEAAFRSWTSPRAATFRRLNDIPDSWGTAVIVQAMVFGNRGETSATGVALTRDPSTGAKGLFGEFLVNAQGEDVTDAIRMPRELTLSARQAVGADAASLEERMPEAFRALAEACARIEAHDRDMQDIQFTIETGSLWMLQARRGKRSPQAALRIAVDLVREGLIDEAEALMRIDPASLDQMLHPAVDPASRREVIATGLPASPGAAVGAIVFSTAEVVSAKQAGRRTILVRVETSPDDISGMHAAAGVLTARGGLTSHAAVVARGLGLPCVAGAAALRIDPVAGTFTVGGRVFRRGDLITIDGSSGAVMAGAASLRQADLSSDFLTLMTWADRHRRLGVCANADTPADVRAGFGFGAEGIGLCRTEHMFFEAGRVAAMRAMILAETEAGRRAALDRLLPMQREDFRAIFEIAGNRPVTVRLLDPPLHEFLPRGAEAIRLAAAELGIDEVRLADRVADLDEFNPMLGHRGVRLAISHPEIVDMQVRALLEAAVAISGETGIAICPEIMVPLVALRSELDLVRQRIDAIAGAVMRETGVTIPYRVGTMIELPRAALQAGALAEVADFFSFGTNDLTQTAFGLSRDDSARFLSAYVRARLVDRDPFVTLDRDGVGELIWLGVARGRATRPDLPIGLCGEHGADPASIEFCEEIGLDYVSCSPFRVPVARLAAAQAAIRARGRS